MFHTGAASRSSKGNALRENMSYNVYIIDEKNVPKNKQRKKRDENKKRL